MMRNPIRAMRSLSVTGAAVCICIVSAPASALAAPEKPETRAASAVTATTATLNGVVNPNAEALTGFEFMYNTDGDCSEGFTTEPGAEVKAKARNVSASVTELEPNREYTFCVLATHQEGEELETTLGQRETFKTPTLKPTLEANSENASGVASKEATLEAQVNANNQSTIFRFEYSTQATGEKLEGTITSVEGPSMLSGFGLQTASVSSGVVLKPHTLYHYRLVAINATGTTTGPVTSFETLEAQAPAIESESASNITSDDATLEAEINPRDETTSYQFEIAANEAFTEDVKQVGETGTLNPTGQGQHACVLIIPPGTSELTCAEDVNQALEPGEYAFEPGKTYYFRVVAKNATGESNGTPTPLTTIGLPQVVGETSAMGITRTSVVLSGNVNPGGAETRYRFAYVEQAHYREGESDPYAEGTSSNTFVLPAGSTDDAVGPIAIEDLKPGTVYDYALVVSNPAGTLVGPNQTFTTAALTPPAVSTGAATGITQTTALLEGIVNPGDLPTTYQFQLEAAPGQYQLQGGGAGGEATESQTVTWQLTNLTAGATIRYRLCATNHDGTVCGATAAFTTTGYPIPTPPPPLTFPLLTTFTPTPPPPTPKPTVIRLTRRQKLQRALKACRKKPKHARAGCQRKARHRYR